MIDYLKSAEALIILAGAGMGVDSGLPDFRGDEGFWNAYPAYAKLGMSFVDCANPKHFKQNPHFGWGFYGHRTELYRSTIPHEGFKILLDLPIANKFVITSNVDGQFQKAGFNEESVMEVHGSIHWLQCIEPCCGTVWENKHKFKVNELMHAVGSLPECPNCGNIARPNIHMFGDSECVSTRLVPQEQCFMGFLNANSNLAIIELGAGTAISTIRIMSEGIARRTNARIIRINSREPEIYLPHYSVKMSALEALKKIKEAW